VGCITHQWLYITKYLLPHTKLRSIITFLYVQPDVFLCQTEDFFKLVRLFLQLLVLLTSPFLSPLLSFPLLYKTASTYIFTRLIWVQNLVSLTMFENRKLCTIFRWKIRMNFSVVWQPNSGLGRLIVKVYTSQTIRYTLGRAPLNERPTRHRGCYLHNTQKTQETNIYALSRIQTRDPSNQAVSELSLTPSRYRHRHSMINWIIAVFIICTW